MNRSNMNYVVAWVSTKQIRTWLERYLVRVWPTSTILSENNMGSLFLISYFFVPISRFSFSLLNLVMEILCVNPSLSYSDTYILNKPSKIMIVPNIILMHDLIKQIY